MRTVFRVAIGVTCCIAVAGCDRWPASDELAAEKFNRKLVTELRNFATQPVRLNKVATFKWDTAYFFAQADTQPREGPAWMAAERSGKLRDKYLDVAIVFMDAGMPVRTITRYYGNSGVDFKAPVPNAVARDAVFALAFGNPVPELRIVSAAR